MNPNSRRTAGVWAALAIVVLTPGCQNVVRENVLSTINTGVGVTLAENPQTQLYEVKVGYIRSQFYSIPTSKTILEEAEASTVTTTREEGAQRTTVTGKSRYSPLTQTAANRTPQVVSGIRMESGAKHLFLGVDITESFAVGEIAVNSPAAVAMYVAGALEPQSAQAAAQAARDVAPTRQQLEEAKAEGRRETVAAMQILDEAANKIFTTPVQPPAGSPSRLDVTRRILDGVDLGTDDGGERERLLNEIVAFATRDEVRRRLEESYGDAKRIEQNLKNLR
jgi:hypothetical protein